MLGALATGRTRITGLLEGEDVLNTAKALQALGCPVRKAGTTWEVLGRGVGGLAEPAGDLDFGNAGTGTRLMLGLIAGHDMTVRAGGRRLAVAPADGPRARSAEADGPGGAGRRGPAAADLRGSADLLPISIACRSPPRRSSPPILLAGLHAAGATTVIEAEATRDHTERMLRHFGAEVRSERRDGGRASRVTGRCRA